MDEAGRDSQAAIAGAPQVAVVPLAGRATRLRPASLAIPKGLFPLVDQDGLAKPVIHFILEEAFGAGIQDVCLVTGPGEDRPFRAYLAALAQHGDATVATWPAHVRFATQPQPEGFGHAVLCAREVVGARPVLVMLGDHVYLSGESRRCARQLVECYARYSAVSTREGHGAISVSAVQRTPEALLHQFGTVAAEPVEGDARTFRVQQIIEKPAVEVARRSLRVPGLPEGEHLCWFGMHAHSPAIFEVLAEDVAHNRRERGEFQLTGAQARLAARAPYLAHEIAGQRLDMGDPSSLLATQAALRP